MAWIQPNHLTVNQTMTTHDLFRGQCFHFILQQYHNSKRFKSILNCERNFAFWHTFHTINNHMTTNLIFSPKFSSLHNFVYKYKQLENKLQIVCGYCLGKIEKKNQPNFDRKIIKCAKTIRRKIYINNNSGKMGNFSFLINTCYSCFCVITCFPLIFLIFRFISSVWTCFKYFSTFLMWSKQFRTFK